jgi:hypothetical protein
VSQATDSMEAILIKTGLLLISANFIFWGARISFSEKYFRYWQNKYWKETNDSQWSDASVKVNRRGTGLGALLFGIAVTYLVLFEMH